MTQLRKFAYYNEWSGKATRLGSGIGTFTFVNEQIDSLITSLSLSVSPEVAHLGELQKMEGLNYQSKDVRNPDTICYYQKMPFLKDLNTHYLLIYYVFTIKYSLNSSPSPFKYLPYFINYKMLQSRWYIPGDSQDADFSHNLLV